ncbi:nuclear transport factor 2 family protein [Maricaulis sp. CAU 1757]
MRILMIAALGLAGCSGLEPAQDESAAASTGPREVAESMYAAFATGDVDRFVSLMHPDIVWNEAENYPYADRNPYIGPDAVMEGVMGRTAEAWEGFAATPSEMIVEGDRVAVLGRYTGTYRATGEAINAQFVHVMTIEDGQAVSFQQFTDTWQVREAMQAD